LEANTAKQTDDSGDVGLLRRLPEIKKILEAEVGRRIIGQKDIIDGLLVTLLAGGHALIVGVPGLAKTTLIATLAETLQLKFNRIQFTPDLMPSDITGTEVLEEDHETGRRVFRFVHGPIFANVILADEINRTPPKTQAALLQAMQEGGRPCYRPCRRGKSRSVTTRSDCSRLSSSSPHRILSSTKERTRSPKPSWIAS